MPNDSSRVADTRTLRLLWASIFSSVGILGGFVATLPPPEVEGDRTLLVVLAAVAIGNAALSFVLPEIVYRSAVRRANVPVDEVPDPDAAAGFAGATRVRVFRDPVTARSLARLHFQQTFILGLALSEAVGLLGFVVNRMGFSLLVSLPFLLISGILIAVRFPTEGAPERRLAKTLGARFPR
jgi:hypothetical protein